MVINTNHLIEREDATLILEAKGKEQTRLMVYKPGQEARVIDSIPTHGAGGYPAFSIYNQRLYWSNPNLIRIYDEDFNLIDTIKPGFIKHPGAPSKSRLKVQPFDENHIILFSDTAPPQLYNLQDRTSSLLNLPDIHYKFTIKDRNGSIWFLGKSEFIRLSEDCTVTRFLTSLEKTADFSLFSGVIQDNQGLLWVSTDNGIFKIAPHWKGLRTTLANRTIAGVIPFGGFSKTGRAMFIFGVRIVLKCPINAFSGSMKMAVAAPSRFGSETRQ